MSCETLSNSLIGYETALFHKHSLLFLFRRLSTVFQVWTPALVALSSRGEVGHQKVSNALRLVFCNSESQSIFSFSSLNTLIMPVSYCPYRGNNLIGERGVGLKNEGSEERRFYEIESKEYVHMNMYIDRYIYMSGSNILFD